MVMPPGEGLSADDRLLESEPALVEALRDKILASGPITFARFMQRALYEADLGYYAVPVSRIGREGDFLTAPEAHGLFGRTLAGQVAECWRRLGGPPRFTLREYGAASGALAAPLLTSLRDKAPEAYAALTYEPVEVNAYRLAGLRARLEGEGTADRLDPELGDRAGSGGARAGTAGATGRGGGGRHVARRGCRDGTDHRRLARQQRHGKDEGKPVLAEGLSFSITVHRQFLTSIDDWRVVVPCLPVSGRLFAVWAVIQTLYLVAQVASGLDGETGNIVGKGFDARAAAYVLILERGACQRELSVRYDLVD